MPTGLEYKLKSPVKTFARDDGASGSGGEPAKISMTEAEFNTKIQEAVNQAIGGLKSKNEELLGKVVQYKDKLKAFDGVDPAKIREIQDRLDNDEDAKLFAEGKKSDVIHKYTERMRQQHEEDLKAEREKTAAESRRADAYRGSVLDNHIRAVCGELHKGAVEDALMLGRTIFSLDEKGNAVKLDANGVPELGKDGKSPFSPAEWMEQQKELKPHWFPSGTGGSGAGGAKDNPNGNGKVIKRADFEKLSPFDQAKVARTTQIVD